MTGWRQLARARAPDGGVLSLRQRGDELAIYVGRRALMTRADHGSEDQLGVVGCRPVCDRDQARVLIGGLGMGFTLRAALDTLPASARVTVAEISEAVVAWNRGPLRGLAGAPLDDPRVTVHVGDVLAHMQAARARRDAILLDVDNGPQGLTRKANHALYTDTGLAIAARALAGGGILAVWSAAHHPDFVRRLDRAGFTVTMRDARARAITGEGRASRRPVIYVATRSRHGGGLAGLKDLVTGT